MRAFTINCALFCASLLVGTGSAEILARVSTVPLKHTSNIVSDSLLGWDSHPSVSSSSTTTDGTSAVYFIGDSFTEGTSWPEQTKKLLEQNDIAITTYNLGTSGYGTLQEFLKLQRHFPEHSPPIVVLQFFAWNDLRDNVGTPAVFYSPHRMQRPYSVRDKEGQWIIQQSLPPLLSSILSHSSLYTNHILPPILTYSRTLLENSGMDGLLSERRHTYLPYTEQQAWDPFYRTPPRDSPYIASAYATSEEILRQMKQYLDERGSLLIVLGLDAAFTVDKDVLLAHVQDPSSFDVSLPLARIGNICKKHGISFINALPALQKEAQRIGKKIYNGPDGNLSGHLEPEGNDVLARLAADAIRISMQEL